MQVELPANTKIEYKYVILEEQVRHTLPLSVLLYSMPASFGRSKSPCQPKVHYWAKQALLLAHLAQMPSKAAIVLCQTK